MAALTKPPAITKRRLMSVDEEISEQLCVARWAELLVRVRIGGAIPTTLQVLASLRGPTLMVTALVHDVRLRVLEGVAIRAGLMHLHDDPRIPIQAHLHDDPRIPIQANFRIPTYMHDPSDTCESGCLEFVRRCVRDVWLHELDEQILLDGKQIFDPHPPIQT